MFGPVLVGGPGVFGVAGILASEDASDRGLFALDSSLSCFVAAASPIRCLSVDSKVVPVLSAAFVASAGVEGDTGAEAGGTFVDACCADTPTAAVIASANDVKIEAKLLTRFTATSVR